MAADVVAMAAGAMRAGDAKHARKGEGGMASQYTK